MRLVQIGGAEIKCSPFVLFAVFIWIICGAWKSVFIFFLALVLHEAAHTYAANGLSYKLCSITLHPFGFSAQLMGKMSICDELCIASAGPLCSLLIGVCCISIDSFGFSTDFLRAFGSASLSVGAINLLPAFPLDGGRVLRACLFKYSSAPEALYVFIGLLFSLVFFAFALFCVKDNPSLIFIGFFLLLSSIMELLSGKKSNVTDMLEHSARIRGGYSLKVKHIAVDGEMPIGEAYSLASGKYYTIWHIVDAKMCSMGAIDEGELLRAISRFDSKTPISSFIDRIG